MTKLLLDFCDYKAALYACKTWHYSHAIPAGKCVKIGVWEDDEFIGCVIFSRGASNRLLTPYGLQQSEGCELSRVALKAHKTPVTKIVSIAIKLLKKTNPGLRLIVSFADSRQGHIGTIYQAGNWIFTGSNKTTPDWYINGRWQHQRNLHSLYGTIKGVNAPKRDGGLRHRYLYPLDTDIRAKIELLRKPYGDLNKVRAQGESTAQSGQDDSAGA